MSDAKPNTLVEIERQVVSLFADGVRVAGLPRSVGEIYGLLFASAEPLAMDDLVVRLHIPKGSVSQGRTFLSTLGAMREVEGPDVRRTYYEGDIELKKLVGGFIREQMRPHMESGKDRLKSLEAEVAKEEDGAKQAFYDERVKKLERWLKQAKLVLPLIQRVLGE